MENLLFEEMKYKGFGDEFVVRYRMINKFFQEKRPLFIIVCGAPASGKSTLAQKLAERLNLSNVIQTDLIYTVN